MAHPFQDKLVVFIGTPRRCKRQAAREALVGVGGIPDEQITAFTNFVVAFDGAVGTKLYQRAVKYDGRLLTILTEEQFFDILEGKAAPPEKPERDGSVVVFPARNQEAEARESARAMDDILNRKRISNLRKYGVPTPEGRVKVDLRPLNKLAGAMRILKDQDGENS